MARRDTTKVPKRITPGTRRAAGAGARLVCTVLAASEDEWVGADLASGALVRSPAEGAAPFLVAGPLEVVELVLGPDDGPSDPARPEAVLLAEEPARRGVLRPRRARRLLDGLAAREREGAPLLGTWGPSVAYVDLDGGAPSVVVLSLAKRPLALGTDRGGAPQVVLSWGGLPQHLPLLDPRLAPATRSAAAGLSGAGVEAALGFRPGYAVVALAGVTGGHARKSVLAILPA